MKYKLKYAMAMKKFGTTDMETETIVGEKETEEA
jgi:hypothetical protein